MADSAAVKEIVLGLGADLCGIAPVERFGGAPEGFRPGDIYSKCRSVVVFAKRVPTEAMFAESCVPYTHVNQVVMRELDALTSRVALALEDIGIRSVPVPTDDPYEHWEPERSYGRAILSLRHAGWLAGLGVLGKNTLLINERFGNMIQIGAVLVDAEIEGDPMAEYEGCIEGCRACLDACPVGALDGITVDQALCRPLSNFRHEKGYILKKCCLCRKACPHARGMRGDCRPQTAALASTSDPALAVGSLPTQNRVPECPPNRNVRIPPSSGRGGCIEGLSMAPLP